MYNTYYNETHPRYRSNPCVDAYEHSTPPLLEMSAILCYGDSPPPISVLHDFSLLCNFHYSTNCWYGISTEYDSLFWHHIVLLLTTSVFNRLFVFVTHDMLS